MNFKSVNKLFEASFRENWDRPAISNYQGATLQYRDLARRIEKLHIMFEDGGLERGDKVALCSRNQEAFVKYIESTLPEVNKDLPNYARLKKIEVMSEAFERTPKKSIKRYLYQRN